MHMFDIIYVLFYQSAEPSATGFESGCQFIFVECILQFQAVLFLTISTFMSTVNRIINQVYICIR